jgi:hypothetical protein
MRTLLVSALLAAIVPSMAAVAAPITTLFDTGVDAAGNTLPNGSTLDPHYTLTSVPGGTTNLAVHTSAGGYPVGPWIGDDALSTWIGPNNDGQLDGPAGTYDYQTTFSLNGFDPATVSITGEWSADNQGLNIVINGIATGQTTSGGDSAYQHFTPFTITSGFVAGVNTIDFIVHNDGGPTGLRVEATGTASPLAVILEPPGLAALASGIIALSLLRRRLR